MIVILILSSFSGIYTQLKKWLNLVLTKTDFSDKNNNWKLENDLHKQYFF